MWGTGGVTRFVVQMLFVLVGLLDFDTNRETSHVIETVS